MNRINIKQIVKNIVAKAKEKTNFPKKGDDKKISLSNSNFKQFPYGYAKDLKENYPSIWRKGGNGGSGKDKTSFTGNDAFSNWTKYRNGDRSQSVLNWIKRRESFMSRQHANKNIAGVIALIKWGGVGSIGVSKMKQVVADEKKKVNSKK